MIGVGAAVRCPPGFIGNVGRPGGLAQGRKIALTLLSAYLTARGGDESTVQPVDQIMKRRVCVRVLDERWGEVLKGEDGPPVRYTYTRLGGKCQLACK